MLCTSVYAAINANLNLKTKTTSLKAGDEFTVTLSLKDLEGIKSGVDSIQGYINIDENVLEKINFDSIVKEDGKVIIGTEKVSAYDVNTLDTIEDTGLFFNDQIEENDYKIVIDLNKKITTEDLVSIKFKVKSNVNAGDYSNVIKYEMFTLTEGVTGQSANLSKSLGIKVVVPTENKVENKEENKVENKAENKVENKAENKVENKANQNKNVNNKSANQNKYTKPSNKDNTLTNKIIPAAGTSSIMLKVLVVIAIVVFAVYTKYKKYKEI